ncbi:MAG: hypothetical protein NTZ98_14855 [Acidobacteria bacterium]|nr:hypothetical protein [Acidobacteriota bacterium]
MNIRLTPGGEDLLRTVLDRHPDQSPAEIVEQALADRLAREQALSSDGPRRKREEIRAWLDELAQFSDKIPPMPGETFARDMIYQNHD